MIRYVLAVLVTALLLTTGFTALEHGVTSRTDQQLHNQIAKVEMAATELVRTEERPPPGAPGPTRMVELSLPTSGLLAAEVHQLVFDPVELTAQTRITYQIGDNPPRATTIPLRVGGRNESELDLGGESGTVHLELQCTNPEDGPPVVTVTILE